MTSRDWHADRAAVFDRDAYTCRHCGATGGDDDPATLRAFPVGDVPLEGEVHESALVTVCEGCFGTTESAPSTAPIGDEDLFQLVRETTRVQGATISDVASFASVATSLPESIESALESDGGETDAAVEEPIAEYRRHRRDVALALAVVDARLERLAVIEDDADDEIRTALAAFARTAADLQSALREVVALGETVTVGLDRCHGCFAALESSDGGTCGTCGLAVRDTTDWETDDGTLAFDRLFETINERLQDASSTTETLTDRTTTLAEHLTAE